MKLAKLLLVAALAAGAAAAQAGMGILWSTGGGWVVAAGGDPDSGPGVAASDDVTWQLVYAGPDGTADAVDLSAADWVGGDDVLLAERSIPAGGGTAADGTSWDDWLIQQGGDATYVDLAWQTDRSGYVFQRIFQGTPSQGTPYAESGLFAFDPAFAGEGAPPNFFEFPADGGGLVLDRTIPTTLKTYPLWVGGVQFTAGNLVIDADDDPGIASGTATFDPASNTLWLTNFVYSGPGHSWTANPGTENEHTNAACIFYSGADALAVSLSGTNSVALSAADPALYSSYGFRSSDNYGAAVSFAGSGSLSARAGAAENSSYGVDVHGPLAVAAGAEVAGAAGAAPSSGGVAAFGRIEVGGRLAGTGGASSNTSEGIACYTMGTSEIVVSEGASVAAAGGAARLSYGILAKTLTVNGGEVTAEGGEATTRSRALSPPSGDVALAVADGLAVFAGEDADSAALVAGDGWKDQKCVRIAPPPPPVAATVTFNNGSGAVVYDGQGHGVEVEVTDPADGAAVLFALGDSSGPTETFGPTAPMFTNACDATVWVEIAAEGYATVTNHADVTITNAPLTIAAKDQTYAYNGQTQGEGDTLYATPGDIAEKVAVSGLAPGDGLASIILDGQGTDPGTYPLVPSGATVTNAVGAYVTDNYAIGYTNGTLTIREPPPVVSNVVARQRWPWNGLVDVDYEVGGDTNLLAGLTARITFEERIEGGTGRIWVASNFLAGAEPSAAPGAHRATWDTAADGATDVVAGSVVATVELVRFVPTIPDVIALAQEGTFSLIGSTVGDFSWGQDVDLAYDAAAGCFSVVTTFKPGDFKILFNHDWSIVMGGEIGAVRFNGGNIISEVDGVYKFILDVNTVPFTIRFEDAALP